MKLSLNMIVQVVALVLQIYNQYWRMIPTGWQPLAALIVGVVQAASALLAHFSNPDGTPASTAYVKQ
jgi:hypothetical protein